MNMYRIKKKSKTGSQKIFSHLKLEILQKFVIHNLYLEKKL